MGCRALTLLLSLRACWSSSKSNMSCWPGIVMKAEVCCQKKGAPAWLALILRALCSCAWKIRLY